jgi:hypothetical protein
MLVKGRSIHCLEEKKWENNINFNVSLRTVWLDK